MSTEYLNYLFTGKFGITTSAGTPFFLIDQTCGEYDSEMLARLGIREEMLPPIMRTGESLGEIMPEICEKYSLPRGTSWVAFMPIKSREAIIENRFLCNPFLSEDGGAWGAMCSVTSIEVS